MITEKQRLRNAIQFRRDIIKTQKNFLRLILKFENYNLVDSTLYVIKHQEEIILALETKLGILNEKGRF